MKTMSIIKCQPFPKSCNPQSSIRIYFYILNLTCFQARPIGIVNKFISIVSADTTSGCQPHISLVILNNIMYTTLRQSVFQTNRGEWIVLGMEGTYPSQEQSTK